MKVTVKVPATSANLGPGFDCLGLALPIYNTITIEETVLPGTGIEINLMSENEVIDEMIFDNIYQSCDNILYYHNLHMFHLDTHYNIFYQCHL